MTEEGTSIVLFTDYAKTGEQSNFYNEVKIWEAARATSAATSFFAPIDILSGGRPRRFLDGALGANNPINQLWIEARHVFGPAPLEPQIRCLLSIGTGIPPLTAFGESVKAVGQSIIAIATETQKTANTFHEMNEDLANRDGYFRFNPPDISEVGLEEASKRNIIEVRTEAYGADPMTKQRMRRFQEAAGEEQISIKIVTPRDAIPSKLFYDLDKLPKYVRQNVDSYWHHLTPSSYEIYEKIYSACKSPNRKVHFLSFTQQFNQFKPSPRMIEEVWTRLLRDKSHVHDSWHPKSFVMATLYMLHMEAVVGIKAPHNPNGVAVDHERREALKRYPKWVPCQCHRQCGKEWNFVSEIGICRGGSRDRECAIVKFMEREAWKNLFASKEMKALGEMKEKWEQNDGS